MATEKWRELTSIEDYEFDPDGKYDGSLYKEDWEEIFNELYQRAETTEEYLDNMWVDPVSTRNAYSEYFNKGGVDYVVLKYYDGMYALYEIDKFHETNESTSVSAQVIEMIENGVSVRQAISEAIQVKRGLTEEVFGPMGWMDKETCDQLLQLMDKWTGGSGKNGYFYEVKTTNAGEDCLIMLTKNPITSFKDPIFLSIENGILNAQVLYNGMGYLRSSGPLSFAGLKASLRELISQQEMEDAENAEQIENTDIYGY